MVEEECPHISMTIWHMAFWTRPNGALAPILSYGHMFSRDDWDKINKSVYAFYDSVSENYVDDYNRAVEEQERAIHESMIRCPKPKRTPQSGWVYILKAGKYYKIGRSKRPQKRYEDLATLPPWPTEMINTIKAGDMSQLESKLHKRFAEKRKRGEWFELDKEDVAWLKTL